MTVNLFRLIFPALAFVSLLPAVALAGPDTVTITRSVIGQSPVVSWHRQVVDKVLVTCGVGEPASVYVAPGYLETTGPAPMLTYRPARPMHPRRVPPTADSIEKPANAPAASPAPAPAANPAPLPAPAPITPLPSPAPADPEPGLLPETGAGNPPGQNHTDEMLSYFQRQRSQHRPDQALPGTPGSTSPNDPAQEPSFLQTPQTPEQPILPPSRATYRVTP